MPVKQKPQPWTIEGRSPTAEEFVDFLGDFKDIDHEYQVHIVKIFLENSELASRCFMEDHKGAVRFARLHRCPTPQRNRRAQKLMRGMR